jgi:hypothetical protein
MTSHGQSLLQFGPDVLGQDDFEQQQIANPAGLGAMLQFGPDVGVFPPAPAAPAPAPVPKKAKRPKQETFTPATEPPKPPAPTGFSADEVVEALAADPNRWREVADAEAERPDGPRAEVIALLLEVKDHATDPVMSDELAAELTALLNPPAAE